MLVLIEETKPVKHARVFVQSRTVLPAVNDAIPFPIDLVENVLKYFPVYLHMAVYDARPVLYNVCEVGTEFLEIYEASLSHVHESETELVALVC